VHRQLFLHSCETVFRLASALDRKQIPKSRPPQIISGENLGIARKQPTARGNVSLDRNSLNLGTLGYHIRDLSHTSLVNGIAVAGKLSAALSPASAMYPVHSWYSALMRSHNARISSRRMLSMERVGGTGEGVFVLNSNSLGRSVWWL